MSARRSAECSCRDERAMSGLRCTRVGSRHQIPTSRQTRSSQRQGAPPRRRMWTCSPSRPVHYLEVRHRSSSRVIAVRILQIHATSPPSTNLMWPGLAASRWTPCPPERYGLALPPITMISHPRADTINVISGRNPSAKRLAQALGEKVFC